MSQPQLTNGSELQVGDRKILVKTRHWRMITVGEAEQMVPMSKIRRAEVSYDRLLSNGGKTEVALYDTDGNKLIEAESLCSKNETFNRKLGRTIALGRAVKKLTQNA